MIIVNVQKRTMGSVLRIALMNMLVLFRLAVVASLALYMLPTATFAMHGGVASSVVVSLDDMHLDHDLIGVSSDHFDSGVAKDLAKNDQKTDKQNCCTDFCMNLAIMVGSHEFGSPRNESVIVFLNDGFVHGQLSSLHRPPSIRA